jgi:hypothetical protein
MAILTGGVVLGDESLDLKLEGMLRGHAAAAPVSGVSVSVQRALGFTV